MNKGYQNFKKRAGQLAIALTLAGTTAIGANAATVTGVTKANVNMRSGAGTKYKVVKVVKANKTVTILGQKGSWYKVKYNGKTGYISKSYVIKKNYTVKKYSGKYKTKVALTVRKGPGTNYVKAGTLKKGTVVTVKGKTSNGWLQISYKGATRYISGSSKYVAKYTAPAKNNAPVINVEDTYTLTKGEDFEYAMLNATATDKEDGDITDKIDFSGVVNTGKVGEYTVKLTVKDSKGATATKTVKVVVKKAETDNKPVIAVDRTVFEVKQNASINYKDLIKASAFDEEDGKVEIVYTGQVDTKKLGEYKVTLTATDKDGNKAVKVVTVKVVRNVAPVINCAYKEYKVEVNKSFSFNDLKATASDFEDGNLTNKINYTVKNSEGKVLSSVDTTKVGKYTVTLTVVDSDGAKATQDITVSVEKDVPPTIAFYDKDGKVTTKDTYTIEQGDALDTSDAGMKAIFNPKADDGNGGDITSKINVIGNDKIDVNKDGTYTVKFQVTDNKDAYVKEAKIVVLKNNAPNITVNKNVDIKQNDTFDYSMLGAKAEDINAVDGKKTPCEVTYKGNVDTSTVGIYTITVSAKDAKGVESVEKVYVNVKAYQDNTAPVISYGEGSLVKNDTLEVKFESDLGTDQLSKLQEMIKAVATDDKDGVITNKIVYSLPETINTKAIGAEYKLTLTVTDSGDTNNENQITTTKVITIKVVK